MNDDAPSGSELLKRRLRSARKLVRSAFPFASGVAAALVAMFIFSAATPPPRPLTQKDVDKSIASAIASVTPRPAYSAGVFQVIRPSLVLIQTQGEVKDGKPQEGLGTGVVVNDQGAILTALHVVANATAIQVTFADGTKSAAQVAVRQPDNDIAVLVAETLPTLLVPATLGNPNAMRVGDEAYVVGNPFGLYASMSAGVISGFGRSLKVPNSDKRLENLIQVDAAVNPGNSGGPLLNRNGEVVGIVSALLNPADQEFFVGIGFAVPITTAGGAAGAPPY